MKHGKPLPEWPQPKYAPKGGSGSAIRVFLDSKTWTPTAPGVLGFDAMIKACSDSTRVKIANRELADLPTTQWLVSASDTFEISGMDDSTPPNVTLEMITIIEPGMEDELAKVEGVRVGKLDAEIES